MNRSDWTGCVTSFAAWLAISTAVPMTAWGGANASLDPLNLTGTHSVSTEQSDNSETQEDPAPPSVSVKDIEKAIDRGANWLIDQQREDGSFGTFAGDSGITALVIHALANCPRGYREADGPFISTAVEYLMSQKRDGGGIYEVGQGLRNYKSSMSLLALRALDHDRTPQYAELIAQLRDYIAGLQCAEDSKPAYDSEKNIRAYGGIGYGGDRRPDLSNTQMALEALQAAELAEDSEVFRRVQVFLSRCQNRAESNDFLDGTERRSTEDGGFFYYPGESKAQNVENSDGSVSYTSYGSMTYAAVKSLIYAGLDQSDPQVAAAIAWIGKNFTVKENPGMATPVNPSRGQMGLFYYYAVMARALEVLGSPTITDGEGRERRWAQELAAVLISKQSKEGSWSNPVDRWWEGDPTLVTAYAIQALSICREQMKNTQ